MSLVLLISSLGLALDLVVHIIHTFLETSGSKLERVRKTMNYMAPSICKGGITTIIGILPLAFASSVIFFTIFRMVNVLCFSIFLPLSSSPHTSSPPLSRLVRAQVFGIALFGLFVALFLLPVLLSYMGPPSMSNTMGEAEDVVGARSQDGNARDMNSNSSRVGLPGKDKRGDLEQGKRGQNSEETEITSSSESSARSVVVSAASQPAS